MQQGIEKDLEVSLEWTPNPKTLKLVVNKTLLSKGISNSKSLQEASEKSPLAEKLFSIDGVKGVMIAKDFITVTIEGYEVYEIYDRIKSCIIEVINSGSELVYAFFDKKELTGIELEIDTILQTHIKPAVAKDGGDINFESFEDGVVYVSLHGSCNGCPSSKITLKNGVETLLKEKILSVKEVVSIS